MANIQLRYGRARLACIESSALTVLVLCSQVVLVQCIQHSPWLSCSMPSNNGSLCSREAKMDFSLLNWDGNGCSAVLDAGVSDRARDAGGRLLRGPGWLGHKFICNLRFPVGVKQSPLAIFRYCELLHGNP